MAKGGKGGGGDQGRLHAIDAGFTRIRATSGEAADALKGLTSAVGGMVSQATKFVEAAAPSAVLVLNQALYDLTAVIGQTLSPVVQAASEAVKLLGGTLAPVMRSLTPVVQQVTGTLLSLVEQALPGLESLGEMFVTLAAGLANLIDILSPIVTVATALTNVFLDLFTGLMEWLGSLIGPGSGLKWAVQELAKAFLTAVAIISRSVYAFLGLAGGGRVLRSLIKTTAPKKVGDNVEDITGTGVAKDAQITNFSDYGKKIAQAALIAGTGAAPKKTDNAWLEELHGTLQDIEQWQALSGADLLVKLRGWLLDDLPPLIAEAIKTAAATAGEKAAGFAGGALDKAPGGKATLGLFEYVAELGAAWRNG